MSEIIKRAQMKVLTTHQSTDDLIIAHMKGKLERSELSPKLQEQVDNMLACEKLIRKYVSRLDVVPMLETTLGVSRSTAYSLYESTQRILGETSVKNQQFWLDIELGALEKDIQGAQKMNDYKSVASLRKIKADLIIKLMGSGDAQLYEKIQPPQVVIGFFPASMKVKLPKDRELQKLASEYLDKIAEDVESE